MSIFIDKSPTADTRTSDYARISKSTLLVSSLKHITDVASGLVWVQGALAKAASRHDFDKLTDIDGFHANFVTGFQERDWLDRHVCLNRHHLSDKDGIPPNVNLIDVMEMVVDCVMAGMARSGSVYPLELSPELLEKAVQNTVALLKSQIIVINKVEANDPV